MKEVFVTANEKEKAPAEKGGLDSTGVNRWLFELLWIIYNANHK